MLGAGVDDDGDLSSELEMMQLTEEQRLERALGAGLAADAPWMAIAEAQVPPALPPQLGFQGTFLRDCL